MVIDMQSIQNDNAERSRLNHCGVTLCVYTLQNRMLLSLTSPHRHGRAGICLPEDECHYVRYPGDEMLKEAVWMDRQKISILVELTICQKNVANALNSVEIILNNEV